MSGVLETAAGAFAVVGVADVLIRAGREITTFLHDVKDAPEDVSRLCQTIEDTIGLANSLKRCIDNLKTRDASFATTDTFTALESATRSSNRELQTLKTATAKFKATKKTWSSVKYALSKDKVAKTTRKLEHLKALLGGCLIQAYGELSADDHTNFETALRTGFDGVATHISRSSQDVQKSLDDLQRCVISAGNVRHHELTIQTRQHMEGLKSTIDSNRNTLLACHDKQSISLSAIQASQSTLLKQHSRVASHASNQIASILRTVERENRKAARASKTQLDRLDNLATDVKQLLSRGNSNTARTLLSNRSIIFRGGNREEILMWLLPLQKEFMSGLDTFLAQHGRSVSTRHVQWLREELQALIDSAIQERAASYTGSTATPIDHWFYLEDRTGCLKECLSERASLHLSHFSSLEEADKASDKSEWRLHNAQKGSKRIWTFPTPSSEVSITLPRERTANKAARCTEEAGIRSRLTQGQAHIEICARFVRNMFNNNCISQYTQLNVFLEVDDCRWRTYDDLFKAGSIEDIDLALRHGTISPFHLNPQGDNLCLYYATLRERPDILDYLENQGVGQSALNHDTSILVASWSFSFSTVRSRLNPTIIPKLAARAADPAAFVSTIAVYIVLHMSWVPDNERLKGLLNACLNVIQQCGYSAPTWESRCRSDSVFESHVDLIRFLFTTGASSAVRFAGQNLIHVYLETASVYRLFDMKLVVDILGVSIELGVDIIGRDSLKSTPSMSARRYQVWPLWCQALENNGKRIEDVLELEGNAWLLQENWREVWKRDEYPCHWTLGVSEEDGNQGSV